MGHYHIFRVCGNTTLALFGITCNKSGQLWWEMSYLIFIWTFIFWDMYHVSPPYNLNHVSSEPTIFFGTCIMWAHHILWDMYHVSLPYWMGHVSCEPTILNGTCIMWAHHIIWIMSQVSSAHHIEWDMYHVSLPKCLGHSSCEPTILSGTYILWVHHMYHVSQGWIQAILWQVICLYQKKLGT